MLVLYFYSFLTFNILNNKRMSKEDYFESGKYERSPKLFITNLPPNIPDEDLKNDIEPLFTPFGKINSINVKKHKSGQYSYAFLQFEKIEDAIRAIEDMDQKPVHERPMKVRQDRQSEGCFNCKKTGHFAKQCPNNPNKEQKFGGRRQRSRDKFQKGRYDNDKYYRRDNRQRDRRDNRDNRDRSDSYDRYDRRRKERSPRQYSPYDDRRRRGEGRRPSGRSPRSKSRSYSDSYDRSRYRRGDYYERDDRRDSRRQERRGSDRREERRDDRRDDRRDRERDNRDDNRKYRQPSRSQSYGSH